MTTASPAVPRFVKTRSFAIPAGHRHSGRHPSIHIGCYKKEHPGCAAEMELPISSMASVFELCGFLQVVMESLGKQDPDPGKPVPGLPEGGTGTRWVPVHGEILQGSACSVVRRLRKVCWVTRNHGKELCLLSMPSSSPSPPHQPAIFMWSLPVSALGALSLATASRAPESEPHHPWRLAPPSPQLPRPSIEQSKIAP